MGVEAENVPGQSGRVTGDVDQPLRGHGRAGVHGGLVHAPAGRVHHQRLRPEAPVRQGPGRLARVGTEKFRVFDAVGPGVFPGVFDGLGHDLRPDHLSRLPGQAQADGPRATVQIQRQAAGAAGGVVQGPLVQLLRLGRVDLEKGLGCDLKGQAQEPVPDVGLSPERVKVPGQDGIAPGLVHVEDNAGELWAGGTQSLRQGGGFGAEAPGGHHAGHGPRAALGLAAEEMPHQALAAGLLVGGDALRRHERGQRPGGPAAELALEQAAPDRDQLMAPLPEKAEGGGPGGLPYGKDGLVPVALGPLAA